MNDHPILLAPEARGQLRSRVMAVAYQAGRVLGLEVSNLTITDSLNTLWSSLSVQDPDPEHASRAGHRAATTVLTHMVNDSERYETDFWSSSLGRMLGWWLGGPGRATSRQVAASILGVSRQGIHKMIHRGALHSPDGSASNGWVTTTSVRHQMRLRFPHPALPEQE